MPYKHSKTSTAPTERFCKKFRLCSIKICEFPVNGYNKKHFSTIFFDPPNHKLIDFLDELQKLAKYGFGMAAQAITEQFINAKMPAHLVKSINQAHLEIGTYEQIVSRLEEELELNGLEVPDEIQIKTVRQQPTQQNFEKSKPTCHNCKKPCHCRNQCRQLKRQKDKYQSNIINVRNNNKNNGGQTKANSNNKNRNNTNANKTNNQKKTENPDMSTHPLRRVIKLTVSQRNVILEQTQLIDRLPKTDDRKDRIRSNKEIPKTFQMGKFKLQPKQ